MKKLMFAALLAAAPAHAFDGAKLAQNLKETLNLDTRTSIEVQGEPRPSNLGGLDVVNVLVGGAPYPVYLTKDGKTYFWGFTADLTVSPDHQRAAAIDLKNVHAIGASTATVTVVEYSDFACSFCRRAHEILRAQLFTTYTPGQVRWVYKHFPLTSHPWAASAAAAAECASRQKPDAFWKMADFFFASQDEITEQNIDAKTKVQIAKLGLKTAAFNACMADNAVKENILAQKKEGAAIGVQSTPTLFVNGRMRRGFRDFDDIKILVEEKLREAGK